MTCLQCSRGFDSLQGAITCPLALAGFFIDPVTDLARSCPNNALCIGGDVLPILATGYWVNRNSNDEAATMYKCLRATCTGVPQPNSSHTRRLSVRSSIGCWTSRAKNQSIDLNLACDSDAMQCSAGSGGILCGSCVFGYSFNSASGLCEMCVSSKGSNAHVLLVVLIIFLMGSIYITLRKLCGIDLYKLYQRYNIFRYVDNGMFKVMLRSISDNKLDILEPPRRASVAFAVLFRFISFFSSGFSFDGLRQVALNRCMFRS
jgi:hypothetical protein